MEITKMVYNSLNLTPFGFFKVAAGAYASYIITKKVIEYISKGSFLGSLFGASNLGKLTGGMVSFRTFQFFLTNANPDLDRVQQEKIVKIFLSFIEKIDEYLKKNSHYFTLLSN